MHQCYANEEGGHLCFWGGGDFANLPKFVGPRAGTIFPCSQQRKGGQMHVPHNYSHCGFGQKRNLRGGGTNAPVTYLNPPVKNQGLLARTGAEGERTHSHGAFVLVPKQELVQPVVAQGLKEPLASRSPKLSIGLGLPPFFLSRKTRETSPLVVCVGKGGGGGKEVGKEAGERGERRGRQGRLEGRGSKGIEIRDIEITYKKRLQHTYTAPANP